MKQPRCVLHLVAFLVLLSWCLPSTGHAAPKALAKPSTPTEAERKAQADAQFTLALESFGKWCKTLEQSHRAAPRDAQVILRLVRCRLLSGELPQADELLARGKASLGEKIMAQAQRISDAEIGAETGTETGADGDATESLWRQACVHFQASLDLDLSIGAQLAVSACHLRRGKFTLARELVVAAIRAIDPQEAAADSTRAMQLKLAQELTRELNRLQPRITAQVHAGFRGSLQVGGKPASLTAPALLDPGAQTVTATLSNGELASASLQASPSESFRLSIGAPQRQMSHRRRILFWSLVGAGAAAAITSGTFYAVAQNKWDELAGAGCSRPSSFGGEISCVSLDPLIEDRGRAYNRTVNYFQASGVGALLLAGGALTVYLTTPKKETLQLLPLASAGKASLTMSASF